MGPQRKPRKTAYTKIELNSIINDTQSPIRVSSRANKSTSNRFNSDEYLTYFPFKRSPFKTPDSTHKKRKKLVDDNQSSITASTKSKSEVDENLIVGKRFSSSNHSARLLDSLDIGITSAKHKHVKAIGSETGPVSERDNHKSGQGIGQLLPISVLGDGKFSCSDMVAMGILGIVSSTTSPRPSYFKKQADCPKPARNNVQANKCEQKLLSPLSMNKYFRNVPDNITQEDQQHASLYSLCRTWVNGKFNRSAFRNDFLAIETTETFSDEQVTSLPAPLPISGGKGLNRHPRIALALSKEERQELADKMIKQNQTLEKQLESKNENLVPSISHHMDIWKAVRSKWVKQADIDDNRYTESFLMLDSLFQNNINTVTSVT
ncbi:uncharacterized protein LOC135923499 isoform X3 [Gordionus sp. m RMFG-2023]|uniref:uncharacterized protein LOC135923499 isoform X3 n=1 Tax=Gordionus sp. m RMFG-2023 TaxID=3053472 RepID=UPI0031FC472C